jgi:hypothetical protein
MRPWLPSGNRYGLVKPGLSPAIDGAAKLQGGIWLLNDVADAAGNNPLFSYQGTVTRRPGHFGGRALTFDGTSGYLDIPLCAANAIEAQPLTVWAWVNIGQNDAGVVVSKGNNTPNSGFNFAMSGTLLSFGAIGGSNMRVDVAQPSITGSWHMLAATWDGVMAGTGVSIYVDGVVQNAADTFDLLIGHSLGAGTSIPSGAGLFFTGSIDHVGFDRRVYTPPEIGRLYNDPFWMLTGEGNAPLLGSGAIALTPYNPWPLWGPALAQ